MKVAIVHDDLYQWGGAERALLEISNLFPEAPIYTSVFDFNNKNLKKKFQNKKIITSFMQKIPFWRSLYKVLLPIYPIAFEQFDFSDYDVVISHGTRFAKAIMTKPQTMHIDYCHTPPRFLWNFSGEKTPRIFKKYFKFLRDFDLISSKRVDFFLAGSKNAQQRINDVYGVESEVLYPFVDENLKKDEGFDGGYFLVIARLNRYKNVDLVVKSFNSNGKRLKIVGTGPEKGYLQRMAGDNIEFLGKTSDDLLSNLIAGCRALIVCAEEDFGLTPLEANLFGKPVIALKKGGVLETVEHGEDGTGLFFDNPTVESLNEAIGFFEDLKFEKKNLEKNAKRYSREGFRENLLRLVKDSHLKYKGLY